MMIINPGQNLLNQHDQKLFHLPIRNNLKYALCNQSILSLGLRNILLS